MTNFTELPSVPSDHLVPLTDQLRLAVAAYLAHFKGSSRYHTESDLRCYLAWCAERRLDPLVTRRLDPLATRRLDLELYIRVDARDPPLQALHGLAAVLGPCPGPTVPPG